MVNVCSKANGMAEQTVQTVKNLLKKVILDKEILMALLDYRNTPMSVMLGSAILNIFV